jgi:hypothetical protein
MVTDDVMGWLRWEGGRVGGQPLVCCHSLSIFGDRDVCGPKCGTLWRESEAGGKTRATYSSSQSKKRGIYQYYYS